jgi:hypothetical protein
VHLEDGTATSVKIPAEVWTVIAYTEDPEYRPHGNDQSETNIMFLFKCSVVLRGFSVDN